MIKISQHASGVPAMLLYIVNVTVMYTIIDVTL